MKFAEELRATPQEFLGGGAIEIREKGPRITPGSPLSWEVRGAAAKPLLHLWSESCNVTRCVLAIADQSDNRISLAVERFGKSKPERLEIVRRDYLRSPKQLSREEFCEQLRRILAEQFPDETLDPLKIVPDLEHSLSRVYARGISRRGAFFTAFLAVPDGETREVGDHSRGIGRKLAARATRHGAPIRMRQGQIRPALAFPRIRDRIRNAFGGGDS